MQQASADASNNAAAAAKNVEEANITLTKIASKTTTGINNLQKSISSALGMLIVSIGLISGAYFSVGLIKKHD